MLEQEEPVVGGAASCPESTLEDVGVAVRHP
jgi:hypothetical protein